MPHVAGISIYPIKALSPMKVAAAELLPSGALRHDREFAILNRHDVVINGKRTDKVHRLVSRYDPVADQITVQIHGQETLYTFRADSERAELEEWLSDFFGEPVRVVRNITSGFPDDIIASGPTIVSTETFQTLAEWFPDLTIESLRRRFRANIEIAGGEPFWEDRLYTELGQVVRFQIGTVMLEGTNPCQRCVVPTRDPLTGEPYPQFQKIFTEQRCQTLPAWAPASRFNHYYRLCVNTRVPPSDGPRWIREGDPVEILGVRAV